MTQKKIRVGNFKFFNKVATTFYVSSQWAYIVEISDWMRWRGIFMRKNEKLKKPTTTYYFFQYFSLFGWLEKEPLVRHLADSTKNQVSTIWSRTLIILMFIKISKGRDGSSYISNGIHHVLKTEMSDLWTKWFNDVNRL
jgi:hypothetical protein